MNPVSAPAAAPVAPAVRDARDEDFAAIRDIYAHHVLHGLATFEETPPDVDEMLARHAAILAQGLPYLVAEHAGRIAGYAYASAFRPRPAYRHTVENSIYLDPRSDRQGLGTLLLRALIERCEQGPWRQMVAVIGNSENLGSIAVHRKLGFEMIGVLPATGYKLGRWVDTVLMQRPLGAGATTHPDGNPTRP